jgi:hypothetical protein
MNERVMVIKGPLTDEDVIRISNLLWRLQGDRHISAAEAKIVDVGIEVSPGRIVRAPLGKFFDFVRRGMFEESQWSTVTIPPDDGMERECDTLGG